MSVIAAEKPASPREAQAEMEAVRLAYYGAAATYEQFADAVDRYRDALRAYKKATGVKINIPARAHLMR